MMRTLTRHRAAGLDRLRGLAVVLMVLDHALVALELGGPATAVRATITRAALPLFALVAGSLLGDSPRWKRLGLVALAGLGATYLGAPIGIGQPDVLLLFALVLAVAPLCGRWWPAVLVLGLLQPTTWPVPWTGYQPGLLLALVVVGRLVAELVPGRLDQLGRRLPRVVELVGRHPLALYLGHLAGLYLLTNGA